MSCINGRHQLSKHKNQQLDRAQASDKVEAIAFDFQKNLPVPNKSTNDVYYRRQLTVVSFNIHVLSTSEVDMYIYDEIVAKMEQVMYVPCCITSLPTTCVSQ